MASRHSASTTRWAKIACSPRRFRNRLILYAVNEMPRASDKTTLFKRRLPTRNGFDENTLPALFAPFTHIRHVIQPAIGDGLDRFTLTSGAPVHTGGNL